MKKIIATAIAICLAATPLWAGSVQDKIKGVIAKSAAAPAGYETGDIASEWFTGSGYQLGACGSAPCWSESNSSRLLEDDTTRTETGFAGDALKVEVPGGADVTDTLNLASANTEGYIRFFIYIGDFNSSSTRYIFNAAADGSNIQSSPTAMALQLSGTASPYTLNLYIDASNRDSATITGAEVHKIELYWCNKGDASCIENSGSDGWAWWIDGVSAGGAANDPAQNVQDVHFGISYTGNTLNYWIDHFDINSTRLDQ